MSQTLRSRDILTPPCTEDGNTMGFFICAPRIRRFTKILTTAFNNAVTQ